jgi:hypothetical protein
MNVTYYVTLGFPPAVFAHERNSIAPRRAGNRRASLRDAGENGPKFRGLKPPGYLRTSLTRLKTSLRDSERRDALQSPSIAGADHGG